MTPHFKGNFVEIHDLVITPIPKLISQDQTAYIKRRTISQNIRLVQDIILYADKHKLNTIILFLDFEKAFDSVEHEYIYKTLTKFNFGENLIRWVKTLYSGCSAKVKNNGYLSESFSISRGIKQGCPVSALLFNLAVETMALSIKKNDKIQGIKITVSNTTYHIKVTQYADDCTLFLAGLNNIPEALAQINKFTKVSGLKLNIEKTEGMNVGTQRPVNDKIYNIKFVNKSIKFLGIYVNW